jgi:ATPase subunit of ABC transporter with duplicated ATPase domains
VMGQLRWLNAVLNAEKNVTLLVTHDDALLTKLTKSGTVGGELML